MKKQTFILMGIFSLLAIVLVFGFRVPVSQTSPTKPIVVTSFYPLYFLTNEIVGDRMDVRNITPSGVEPHDYEPTAMDLRAIEKSSLIVLNGSGLEAWGSRIPSIIDPTKTKVITLADTVEKKNIGPQPVDPHFWLSPQLALQMVNTITEAVVSTDPTNTSYYETNSALLIAELHQLDADFKSGLSTCTQRNFVTSHNAFGYLSSAYALTQVPIAGLSPESEPSPKQLMDIAAFVRDHHVDVIFFEQLTSPKFSETIAQETHARVLVLDPIEGISAQDQKLGKNYFTLMRDNLTNLRIALHCTP